MIDLTKPMSDPEFWAAINTPLRSSAERPYPMAIEGHDEWGRQLPDYMRSRRNHAFEAARAAKIRHRRRLRIKLRVFLGVFLFTLALIALFAFGPAEWLP
jgi:hypothetical protein